MNRRGRAFAEVDLLDNVRPRVLSGPETLLENLNAALKVVEDYLFVESALVGGGVRSVLTSQVVVVLA